MRGQPIGTLTLEIDFPTARGRDCGTDGRDGKFYTEIGNLLVLRTVREARDPYGLRGKRPLRNRYREGPSESWPSTSASGNQTRKR